MAKMLKKDRLKRKNLKALLILLIDVIIRLVRIFIIERIINKEIENKDVRIQIGCSKLGIIAITNFKEERNSRWNCIDI